MANPLNKEDSLFHVRIIRRITLMPEGFFRVGGGQAGLAILSAVLILVVSAYALYDINADSFQFSDREYVLVVTGSMATGGGEFDYPICPIPVNSLVIIQELDNDDLSSLKIGDVVAYRQGDNLIVHRLVSIDFDSETMVLKGDANTTSETVEFTQVVGMVIDVHPVVGEIIMLLRSKMVFILVELACLFLVITCIRDILRILKETEESE